MTLHQRRSVVGLGREALSSTASTCASVPGSSRVRLAAPDLPRVVSEVATRRTLGRRRRAGAARLPLSLYDPTFSRTVWRMYGGAKGLVVWY